MTKILTAVTDMFEKTEIKIEMIKILILANEK